MSPDFRDEGDGWFMDAKGHAHSVRHGAVECGVPLSRVGIVPVRIDYTLKRQGGVVCPACKDAVTAHWCGGKAEKN